LSELSRAEGSMGFVELLKERSRLFHEYAREAFARGHYDLSVFNAEQALQLRLKALHLRMVGYVPRLHSVRELLGVIARILEGLGRSDLAEKLSSFVETHRDSLRMLEEAYIASRYTPKTYERDEAERALATLEEAMSLIDEVERLVFS